MLTDTMGYASFYQLTNGLVETQQLAVGVVVVCHSVFI